MEDIDISDDSPHSHLHEKQPLTSMSTSAQSPYYPSYQPQHQHQHQQQQQQQQQQQWRPHTPKFGSPLGSPPLDMTAGGHASTPPTPSSSIRRNTGEFSRQWKSSNSPTSGVLGTPSRHGLASPSSFSLRNSSETMRPPSGPSSRRSSISSTRSISHQQAQAQEQAGLPRKYISPEMNKVLHRQRLSESGITMVGRSNPGNLKNNRTWFSRFRNWGDSMISSTSLLRWMPEVLWIILSMGCLIAIAMILKSFDRKPQPDWPGPFNLNTLVAFLTVLAQTAYLVPVVEGLGQLCWLRFTGGGSDYGYGYAYGYGAPRPLRDFEVIDAATRGRIHGSLGLLFGYRRGGFLGILGALIIITSIFTTPLTQGMISYAADLIHEELSLSLTASRNTTTVTSHHDAYTNQTVVHIQWGYLLPLLIQIILSMSFLASIVVWTRMEGIQIFKTSSLATMVALRSDSMESNTNHEGQGTAGGGDGTIGSIADIRTLEKRASTLRVRLEKDPLSGLALGLVPVYDVGDSDEGGGGGSIRRGKEEDLESKLTGGNEILRTRMSSARDRRRKLNRNTRIVGGVVQ